MRPPVYHAIDSLRGSSSPSESSSRRHFRRLFPGCCGRATGTEPLEERTLEDATGVQNQLRNHSKLLTWYSSCYSRTFPGIFPLLLSHHVALWTTAPQTAGCTKRKTPPRSTAAFCRNRCQLALQITESHLFTTLTLDLRVRHTADALWASERIKISAINKCSAWKVLKTP